MVSSEVRTLEMENDRLKQAVKALEETVAQDGNHAACCEYCKNYIQHYVKVGLNYTRTYCGHCIHGRIKKRRPEETCKYFEIGTYEKKYS